MWPNCPARRLCRLTPTGSGGPALHVPVCAGLTGPRFETGCHCVTGLHRCLITFRCLKGLFKTQGKLTPEVLEWLLVRWPLRQLCPKKV